MCLFFNFFWAQWYSNIGPIVLAYKSNLLSLASLLTFIFIGSGDRFISLHCNTDQPPRRTTATGLIVTQVLYISKARVYIFATISNLFCSNRPLFLRSWQRAEWLFIEPLPHLSFFGPAAFSRESRDPFWTEWKNQNALGYPNELFLTLFWGVCFVA